MRCICLTIDTLGERQWCSNDSDDHSPYCSKCEGRHPTAEAMGTTVTNIYQHREGSEWAGTSHASPAEPRSM